MIDGYGVLYNQVVKQIASGIFLVTNFFSKAPLMASSLSHAMSRSKEGGNQSFRLEGEWIWARRKT
jgi:hypothetical protein